MQRRTFVRQDKMLSSIITQQHSNFNEENVEIHREQVSSGLDLANLIAVYFNDKLPPLLTPTRRNTNPQIYREIRSKTRRFKTSFSSNDKESWNNVMINFHGNITLRKHKIHLLCLLRPEYQSVPIYTI